MKSEESSLGRRIAALRTSLRQNQRDFARSLGVSQGTISVWEKDVAEPPASALFRMGSSCKEPAATIWFWKRGGLDEDAIVRAAAKLGSDRIIEPPKGKVVAVPPLSDEWFPVTSTKTWYVDARLVPNPATVGYWEGLGRDTRGKGRREVIVVDTAVTDLRALWDKFVLMRSLPSEDEEFPLLPPRGLHMGRFSLRLQRGEFTNPRNRVCEIYFTRRNSASYFLPVHQPRLTASESSLLNSKAEGEAGFLRVNASVEKIEKREKGAARLPDGLKILGRVITWFRPPEKGKE